MDSIDKKSTGSILDSIPIAVQKGVSLVKLDKAPDEKDIDEIRYLERERARLDNANREILIGLRKSFGRNIIRFMWAYFIFTGLILLIDGFKVLKFNLPDPVLSIVAGSSLVSILGLVGTVAAGLFKVPEQPDH